ncbi:hypothetical protein L0F63_006884, partial [Massospora cicadina]
GSLSQRTGKKVLSAIKATPKSMVLDLDKLEAKPKATPKRKNIKVSNNEEDFEVEATLPTISKAHPFLSSEEEEPSEVEMDSVLEYSM